MKLCGAIVYLLRWFFKLTFCTSFSALYYAIVDMESCQTGHVECFFYSIWFIYEAEIKKGIPEFTRNKMIGFITQKL